MPPVADVVVDILLAAGVSRLFGVSDAGALVESARARGLAVERCRQASAACIMAAVTGELTGQPGAAWARAGPAVADSVTGLAHAFLDRSPMLFLTEALADQAPDQRAVLAPVVKDSLELSVDSASHWPAHAVQLALRDPRGPVHIDMPAGLGRRQALPIAVSVTPPMVVPEIEAIEQVARLIGAARRPLVIAGRECRGPDARWLRAFAESTPAPA